MNKTAWKDKIIEMLIVSEIYKGVYVPIVDELAEILERRDIVYQQFIDEGEEAVVIHTNKGGNANAAKNPLLVLWNELNQTALKYWRELLLTPSSLKKITGGKIIEEEKKPTGLEKVLSDFEEV